MSQLGMIKEGGYLQETKAGVLEVIVDSDHKVMMQMSLPEFGATNSEKRIAESLNPDESKIDAPSYRYKSFRQG
jgi:predicted PhzF superfamily epimerase YddE/YHI9